VSRLPALLRLARISNLPTVWSNVLAASVLAGGMSAAALAQVMLAMSLLYTGGMFLNDAFDERFDVRERPERPLPSGAISSATVWISGLGMLALGALLLAVFGVKAALAGVSLAVAILLYNAWHKGNPIAPFVMGLCRALVYVGTVVCAAVPLTLPVIGASAALLTYVAGLTFAAQQESFDRVGSWRPLLLLMAPVPCAVVMFGTDWPALALSGLTITTIILAIAWLQRREAGDVKRAVTLLVAAIALVDATFAASAGNTAIAIICCALFALTVLLQRFVPGT
jgi:4-hydroxybenzoate polyprenyltransferase